MSTVFVENVIPCSHVVFLCVLFVKKHLGPDTKYCMIQFANKEALLCSSHCLSFCQVFFFFTQRKFCKKGVFVVIGVLHNMKVGTHMVTGHTLPSMSEHTRRHVVATSHGDRSLHVYRWDD